MLHKMNCSNAKCYSKKNRFQTINLTEKKDLHTLTLSIIKCVFKTAQKWLLTKHNINSDLQFEQLQLQYISFISEIAVKPLIGYLELRSYQNNKTNNNSTYFIEITNKLATQLEKQITDNQIRMNAEAVIIKDQRSQLIEITLQQQWYTQNLYETLLQKFLQIVDLKIAHWEQLINGYKTLNPFQQKTEQLCQGIYELKKQIDEQIGVPQEWFDSKTTTSRGIEVKKMSHAELNINVITLKLYSIFYSLLLNDFDRTNYIEQYIKEITSNDRQKEIDIIDNLALIQDMTTMVLVSVVKNKGKIKNRNQLALANFFQYKDANEFKDNITTIHKLLPKAMMATHEKLIDKFVQTGHSEYFVKKISGYYESKQGFLEKGYVKLGNLFEDLDDYVITASILKCNTSNQLLLVDTQGKIIGLSENFLKIVQKYVPQANIEFMKDFCHIFLFFPQFLAILKQSQSKLTDIDHRFADDEEYLFYLTPDLVQLNTDYVREEYERNGNRNNNFGSLNLSSWRTWKSKNSARSLKSNASENLLLGQNIELVETSNIDFIYKFMISHRSQLQGYTILKTRMKLALQWMKVKSLSFPYFIIEMDHFTEYGEDHKYYQKYPSMEKAVRLSHQLISEKQFLNKTIQDQFTDVMATDQGSELPISINKATKTATSFKSQSLKVQPQPPKSIPSQAILDMIHLDNSNILNHDASQIRLFVSQHSKDLNDISVIQFTQNQIFEQPIKKNNSDQDNDEFMMINEHFNELQRQETPYVEQSFVADQQNDLVEQVHVQEKEQSDSQLRLNADNLNLSSIRGKQQNDLLDLLRQNRQNRKDQGDLHEEEEEVNAQKQRSVASSSRTSTSKSPFLLVRTLYQVGTFQGDIRLITFIMGLFVISLLILTFVGVNQMKANYDNLQSNINFVTYPETLNFYFQKMTMFSWQGLYEQLGVIKYSQFIHNQNQLELKNLSNAIESQMNSLYGGIIQYEEQILNDELKLVSVNEVEVYVSPLDLTQLIQQIELHSINYIENYRTNPAATIPNSLFFRLNIQYVYSFAQKFISLLNTNLIYFEDKILNDVINITGSFIAVFTVLLLYGLYLVVNLTSYERQILMLITRVSEKAALEIIQRLMEVKLILLEPSQLEWKQFNYFDICYDMNEQAQLRTFMQSRSSKGGSTLAKTAEASRYKNQKSKRSYQNNSLSQRIGDLSLSTASNYLIITIAWALVIIFIIGFIVITSTQVSDIKPTLNLNLALIQFKLRFDSLIVQGEVLKTQQLVQESLKYNYTFTDNLKILTLFDQQVSGFQESMNSIYNSLSGNSGLQTSQQDQLLIYFQDSLCLYMAEQIPFCEIKLSEDTALIDAFSAKYGTPYPQDNDFIYISNGITGIVSELSKQIQQNFYEELVLKRLTNQSQATIVAYLNSTTHINDFVEYFLFQGKLLTIIGDSLQQQNQSKLNQSMTVMQQYIYITGLGLTIVIIFMLTFWLRRISKRLKLMRLSLTLIPYEVLMEPKTLSALKQL